MRSHELTPGRTFGIMFDHGDDFFGTLAASHLLSARVQFLVEMLLIEIATPTMLRTPEPALYDVPLLRFG